jgi:hypothetical protein
MNPIPLYNNITEISNNDDICAICLDNINTLSVHTLSECNHKFHSTCLIESLRVNTGCPLCRGQSNNQNYYRRSDATILRHILSFCKSKKNTSKKLKTLVKTYEKIRDNNKIISKELKIFRNKYKDILKTKYDFIRKKRTSDFKLQRIKRTILSIPIQPINKTRR